jgi:hypothetical protein
MLPAIEGKVSQNVHKKSYDDIVLEAKSSADSEKTAAPCLRYA